MLNTSDRNSQQSNSSINSYNSYNNSGDGYWWIVSYLIFGIFSLVFAFNISTTKLNSKQANDGSDSGKACFDSYLNNHHLIDLVLKGMFAVGVICVIGIVIVVLLQLFVVSNNRRRIWLSSMNWAIGYLVCLLVYLGLVGFILMQRMSSPYYREEYASSLTRKQCERHSNLFFILKILLFIVGLLIVLVSSCYIGIGKVFNNNNKQSYENRRTR